VTLKTSEAPSASLSLCVYWLKVFELCSGLFPVMRNPARTPSDRAAQAPGQLESHGLYVAVIIQSFKKPTSSALTELRSCEPRWLTNVDSHVRWRYPKTNRPISQAQAIRFGGAGLDSGALFCALPNAIPMTRVQMQQTILWFPKPS